MDNKELAGRDPLGQALVQAPSPAVSALTGFDPSRFKPDTCEGKPRHLGKEHRAALNEFVDFLDQRIDEMTPQERGVLLEACFSVSPINCAWDTFKMAEIAVWHLQETAIATEAGTAETENTGSVHEGAGLQGITQPQSLSPKKESDNG